ncbi:hypothetical protein B566_EDAN010683 [Ephemera danica]|nr:hypothetical protein B566_EDAN010683 [Ephemera danica]
MNTQSHYDMMSQFLSDNSAELDADTTTLIRTAMRTVENIVAWNVANLDTITNYFNTI